MITADARMSLPFRFFSYTAENLSSPVNLNQSFTLRGLGGCATILAAGVFGVH
jgi:hypothetical protein